MDGSSNTNTVEIDPAKPEPMPINASNGVEIVPLIISEIEKGLHFYLINKGRTLIEWLNKRSDFGFKKYNARLTYPNGRNWHKDLCDELADAVNYARGAFEAGQISSTTYTQIIIMADRVINRKELS